MHYGDIYLYEQVSSNVFSLTAPSHYLNQCQLIISEVLVWVWKLPIQDYNHTYPGPLRPRHNGRHFADDIFKCNFLNEYIYKFRLTFDWSFFLGFKLTIFKHWFRKWLGAGHATSLYLSQWWSRLLTHICVTWPQWVKYQYYCKYCDKWVRVMYIYENGAGSLKFSWAYFRIKIRHG